MSVRRLAETQPESFAFTAENQAIAEREIAKYPPGRQHSAVIGLLWQAQLQEGGWLPEPAIRHVARLLDMPFIRALEVATFYTMFNLEPVGRKAHIQVCGTTPCMLRGAEELKRICRERINPEPYHLSEDGDFSWVEVECAGACVNAPMVQIDSDTFEDLTPETFNRLIDDLAAGRPVTPGPQVDRQYSEPEGGATTLTDLPQAQHQGERVSAAPHVPLTNGEAAEGSRGARFDAKPAAKAQPYPTAPADAGKGDDLKLISGVGPKLEERLHELGITTFEQIAAWTADDIARLDEQLKFHGRIERDDWIGQARALLGKSGGEG